MRAGNQAEVYDCKRKKSHEDTLRTTIAAWLNGAALLGTHTHTSCQEIIKSASSAAKDVVVVGVKT